jgi:hypothetical protein
MRSMRYGFRVLSMLICMLFVGTVLGGVFEASRVDKDVGQTQLIMSYEKQNIQMESLAYNLCTAPEIGIPVVCTETVRSVAIQQKEAVLYLICPDMEDHPLKFLNRPDECGTYNIGGPDYSLQHNFSWLLHGY